MVLRRLAILLSLLAGAFTLSAPAQAQEAVESCHAYSAVDVGLEQAGSLDWTCGDRDWRDGQAVAWLRFVDWDRAAPPAEFHSRITVFDRITIAARDAGGTLRQQSYTTADARPVVAGAVFTLPLPEARADTVSYLVRIERPHSVTVASEAGIGGDPRTIGDTMLAVMLLTLVAGMLLTPLLFDINFYLVLRERFVVLHAAMIIAMMLYLLLSGGLLTALVVVPLPVLAIGGPLSWAFGVGAAGFFVADFLEQQALPPKWRKLLLATAAWAIVVPGFCSLQVGFTQGFDNRVYFLSFIPVIAVYVGTIVLSVIRGSRAGRFLAAAWFPIIVTAAERLLRGLGLYAAPSSVDLAMFLALGLEVLIIALGVADRFLAVRRERDRAMTEVRTLEQLSERDPLTGLMNRRYLQDRFDDLRGAGFTTLAVVDLDRFKLVNDTHGHSKGDQVLRAVATALAPDKDTLAFRMGGEEFMLLLRGTDVVSRAERRRQAIPAQVANLVGGLDRVVTASMGLVEMPREARLGGFQAIYERADRLLYEAKQAGRNRTVSERLKLFRPRRNERRKESAVA